MSTQQDGCYCTGKWLPREECPVIREFRQLGTPEGREQARQEYALEAERRRGMTRMTKGQAAYKLQQLGVPSTAIMALRDLNPSPATNSAQKFCMQAQEGPLAPFLALLGPPGIGKTVGAALVLQEAVMRFPWNEQATGIETEPLHWVAARELTSLSAYEKDHRAWVERLKRARLVVLDDAGDEGTRIGREALADLLLHRADGRKQTVITANLTWEALTERYGKALADRIRSIAIVPNLSAEQSRRKRSAA